MFIKSQLLVALVATTASVFGLASGALAGEGGAAAGAAFSINGDGAVTGAAVSAAVGKQGAFAGANNTTSGNAAYALGSAGVITLSNIGVTGPGAVGNSQDNFLVFPQANSLTVDANASNSLGSLTVRPDSSTVKSVPLSTSSN